MAVSLDYTVLVLSRYVTVFSEVNAESEEAKE
jgi:hypothetical protein